MYKSHLLLLLSGFRYFDTPNDQGSEKTAAQIERDKIKVTTSKPTEQPEKETTENGNDDGKGDEESDEDGEDDGEESDESGKDKESEGEKELTVEDYKKDKTSLEKRIARLEKRTGKTAGERDQLKKDKVALETQLQALKDAKPENALTEEEVEKRANSKALELVNQREFERAQTKLINGATKVDKDFMKKINEIAVDIAPISGAMFGALEDMDKGGEVLAYLANNPDDYEEIIVLSVPAMVRRLNKIEDTLIEEAKTKGKKDVSKVPKPLDTTKGGHESPNVLPAKPNKDQESMEKFVKLRQQQTEARRKAKLS